MARNVEFALLAGQNTIYQPDALDSFAGSPETAIETRIATKWWAPQGPAGEAVLKAFLVHVVHRFGFTLEATPVADGVLQIGLTRQFTRPATGAGEQRVTLRLPCGRFYSTTYSSGLRATSFGLRMLARSPAAPFHIDTVTYESVPLHAARGRAVGE